MVYWQRSRHNIVSRATNKTDKIPESLFLPGEVLLQGSCIDFSPFVRTGRIIYQEGEEFGGLRPFNVHDWLKRTRGYRAWSFLLLLLFVVFILFYF